jgi:ferredoxin
MGNRIVVEPDKEFIREVMEAGGGDLKKCFQCATCASTCSLSPEDAAFPRRQMLLAQWGMKDELLKDPAPWLCFYCGECSKSCPRQANPGETMMALRRYLTTQYDWTGLSRLMYRSAAWEIGILALVAAFVVALFTLPQSFGFGLLYQSGSLPLANVMLDRFAPKEMVHLGDAIMASLLSLLLLINAARMFLGLTRDDHIPARRYFAEIGSLILQGVTQMQWKKCNDSDASRNWIRHLFLVSGYATIFTLVVVFLPWFQIEDSSFHWTSVLGYYSTVVLLVTTSWMVLDRVNIRTEMHRFSHLSDWLFPILLFLTALTGILVNVLRLSNLPMPTYVMYVVHMAIAVPMLVVEVPFGKWSHLLYRPLGIFVATVKRKALESAATEEAVVGPALSGSD